MKTSTTTQTITYSSIEERDARAARLVNIHSQRNSLKREFHFSSYDRKIEIEDRLKLLNRELARI